MTTAHPVATGRMARRRRIRARAVGAAVLAPVAVWLVAKAAGADLVVDLHNGQPPMTIGLPIVIGFAAQAALLGWITLALLERFTSRGRAIWTGLAGAVLLVSFVPILSVTAEAGTKVSLSLMHVAVGAALIPFLPRRNP